MVNPCDWKPCLSFLLTVMLLLSVGFPIVTSTFGNPSISIETEDFRWSSNRFPLKVLVDMNQSTWDYAVALREALDSWLHSIWNYTKAYGANLPNIDYRFYMSNINATSNYDVLITFSPNEMPPDSGIVGLTSSQWNPETHEPIPPIIINVTTFQKTIYALFVKNVAMHEFGHALGLGHASSSSTSNGPELMYNSSRKDQITYPSTLDVYALTKLYQGNYDQQVQLLSSIPYVMLSDGSLPPPSFTIWDTYFQDLVIVAILILAPAIALTLRRMSKKSGKVPEPPPVVSSEPI
jgi:hypothetical protein